MDFGGGFATGIGVGMGSGMAIGLSSGKKQALNQIRDHVERHGITMHDRYGAPVKVDDLLETACALPAACGSAKRTQLLLVVLLALGVAAAMGLWLLYAL